MSRNILKMFPLLSKMFAYIFLFSLTIIGVTLIVYFWLSIRVQTRLIEADLNDLQNSQLSILANNIWTYDNGALDIQLKSILGHPDIVFIELITTDNDVFRLGSKPINSEKQIWRHFPILRTYKNKEQQLGTISICASTELVKNRSLHNALQFFAVGVLSLSVVCLFMVILFISLFNRHIVRIVKFTDSLALETLDKKLALPRKAARRGYPDELDRIVLAINGMLDRITKGIAETSQAEHQLYIEKLFSDAVINQIPGILFVIDDSLALIRWNRSFELAANKDPAKHKEFDFWDWVGNPCQKMLEEQIQRCFQDGSNIAREISARNSKQIEAPFLFSGTLLSIEHKRYLICHALELTEQKKLEHELNQAHKMEAMGVLAGGIAHDFNNLLSGIIGYHDLALKEAGRNEKLNKYLGSMNKASMRAKELVHQILAFSRKNIYSLKPVQLQHVVNEALKLLRSSIPSTIRMKHQISTEKWVIADATAIHQIVMNLCTNAYHSMQDKGGELTVNLIEVQLPMEPFSPRLKLPEGNYLLLEVKDTGCGMEPAILQKIFEPYFTTKPSGEGTGLGLAVVHGIIINHSGQILVDSTSGEGTTFRVFLPCLDEPSLVEKPKGQEESVPQGKGEWIMVVEDEPYIIDLIQEIIDLNGYKSVCFQESPNALHEFKKNASAFDLIISDFTMPDLNGIQLWEKIKEIRSEIPFFLVTGQVEGINEKELGDLGIKGVIRKPFNANELLQKINQALSPKDFQQ